MTLFLNIALGLVPTFVLAGSIAAGTDDHPKHGRVFLLVYGLWALTLAGWNWLESSHVAWIVLWLLFGLAAIGALAVTRRRENVPR